MCGDAESECIAQWSLTMWLQRSVDSCLKSEQLSVGPSIFQKLANSIGLIFTPERTEETRLSSVAMPILTNLLKSVKMYRGCRTRCSAVRH